jgi:peptide/nickel transport system permease protein
MPVPPYSLTPHIKPQNFTEEKVLNRLKTLCSSVAKIKKITRKGGSPPTTNTDIMIGVVLGGLILAMTVIGIFYTPADPYHMDSTRRFLPPGREHLLGTDHFGRDIFSRVIRGGAYTIAVALLTVFVSAAAGTALGLLAAYSALDDLIMRTMDIISSFPGLLVALTLAALMGSGSLSLCIALAILFTPGFTRITRNAALQFKTVDFILAERLLGAGMPRIIFIHIFPNIAHSLLAASVMGLSNAILAEAALSYLGLGIQPPIPSWGRMLAESQHFLSIAPWCALAPGICIVLCVLTFHYLGEGIRRINSAVPYSGRFGRKAET